MVLYLEWGSAPTTGVYTLSGWILWDMIDISVKLLKKEYSSLQNSTEQHIAENFSLFLQGTWDKSLKKFFFNLLS